MRGATVGENRHAAVGIETISLWFALCLAMLVPTAGRTEPRRFNYTAAVVANYNPGQPAIGTEITGFFGYDDAAAPAFTTDGPDARDAVYKGKGVYFVAEYGGQRFTVIRDLAIVMDYTAYNPRISFSISGYAPGRRSMFFGLAVTDYTRLIFSDLRLPASFPVPGLPPSSFLFAGAGYARIESITPASAIPEAPAWTAMIAGFTILGAMMRRRARHCV